jgi:NADPH:quinone reductase-like Zn-dependent oxidoreductase
MKALVPTGQSRALVALADTGVPEPQPGEALVKVEAFSSCSASPDAATRQAACPDAPPEQIAWS